MNTPVHTSQSRPIHAILVVTPIDGVPATVALDYDEVGHSMAATPSQTGFGQLMAIYPDSLPRLKGRVERVRSTVAELLHRLINTVSSPGDEETTPVAIHALTAQEAEWLSLLRSCDAHRAECLQTLTDLIGADAVAKLRALYGGCHIYIPKAPSNKTETPVRQPAFRISGTFSAQVPLNSAVTIVATTAAYMNQNVNGLVVEVEPHGLGQAYLDRLAEVLTPLGIQVKPQGAQP